MAREVAETEAALRLDLADLSGQGSLALTTGRKILAFVESGAHMVVDVDHMVPVSVDLSPLKSVGLRISVPGIRLVYSRRIWNPLPTKKWFWIDIPRRLIVSASSGVITIYGTGLELVGTRHYVVVPGRVGRAILLKEAVIEFDIRRAETLATMLHELTDEMQELAKELVELSPYGHLISDLGGVAPPVPPSPGVQKLQEYLKQRLERLGGR